MRSGLLAYGLLALALVLGAAHPARSEPRLLVDMAGRTVSVPETVERFVISDGSYAALLAALRPEAPMRGVVGMMSRIGERLPALEAAILSRQPEVADIPLFGLKSGETVSAEAIIAAAPQLAIFGLQDHGPGAAQTELIAQLESAGVAVLFIDFRLDPTANTLPSVELVGRALGAEARAAAYAAFYREKRAAIAARVATAESRPRVFFQAHVGRFPCCVGFADGMLGPFVELAGGENIADKAAPGPVGRHTEEFLLVENPDVLIGSASGTARELAEGATMLALGDGVSDAAAQASLARNFVDPRLASLDAVRTRRVHAIWHDFYNSPFNIAALEALAAWIHPELFADADPQATLAEIHRRFLGVELDGTYFATLGE